LQLENGKLNWVGQGEDGMEFWSSEPHLGLWLRLQMWLVSLLPIEHLL